MNYTELKALRDSRKLIKFLQEDGWYLIPKKKNRGSHHFLKHPTKKGKVTVQHPDKDIELRNVKSALKQAGLL